MSAPPSYLEFERAIKRMKPGKAPGPDNIPLEFYTRCGPEIKNNLMMLILKIWETKTIPQDFKDVNIVTIFKKGDREDCNNYRGISLLSTAGKIFARILLDRLLELAEEVLPESQCGFRPSRGTIDMVFCARQLQEKSLEQQQPAMFIFWDLKKAFDKVPRLALWAVLARFGCPPDFVSLIRALHDGMFGRVLHQGALSDPFSINGGLRQGCPLAPVGFSLYVAALINEIPPEMPAIDLRFRMDGGAFNLKRLKARARTSNTLIRELQYADDSATPCQSAEDLQRTANAYNSAYERFGMQVNTDKTKTLIQHPPGRVIPNTDTSIGNQHLEEVNQFSYLGSILTPSATCKKEVESRIRAAYAAFGRLTPRVFNNHALTRETKIMVFQAVVMSTLLYASETWTLYKSDLRSLERFQQQKLRQILGIRWESHTTNNEVLRRASAKSVEACIAQHRLRWAGHILRMEDTRLPKIMLFGELANESRPRGRPKLRYKDQLKSTLNAAGIGHETWEETARDRTAWRRAVRDGATTIERNRIQKEEERRRERRERMRQPPPQPTIPCPHCRRFFCHRLGLASHIKYKHPQIGGD